MPSIIGNSLITNLNTGLTGPTGPQGPRGETGPDSTGNTGNTGNTGAYIVFTSLNTTTNTISLSLSHGNTLTVTGITGPTGYYSNIVGLTGLCAAFNTLNPNKIFSLYKQTVGGRTLEFRGVTGAGTINASLDPSGNWINLTVSSAADTVVYGNTASNFLLYTTPTLTATTTRIGVTGSNSVVSIGLTAHDGATGSRVKVYSDFNENAFIIHPVWRDKPQITTNSINDVITGIGNDGLTVNLDKYSVYNVATPVGISSFTSSASSSEVRSYTLFIHGSDVWNFPSNVFFENTPKGLANYGFLNGRNIVHMWTANGGLSFNANIIERGIGTLGPYYSDSVGSCCALDGTCIEYISPELCEDIYFGLFNPGKPCDESCGVFKSCCLDEICYSNVEESICVSLGGIPKDEPCNSTLCLQDVDGACCLGFGVCTNTNRSGCISLGGHFTPNKNCNQISDQCGDAEIGICGNPDDCKYYDVGNFNGDTPPQQTATTRRDCNTLITNQVNCAVGDCKLTEWLLDFKFYPRTILPGIEDNVWPAPNLQTTGVDGLQYPATDSKGCFNGQCCAVAANPSCESGVNGPYKFDCRVSPLLNRFDCRQRSVFPWYEYWNWTKVLGQTCGDLKCNNVRSVGNGLSLVSCCLPSTIPSGRKTCVTSTLQDCVGLGGTPTVKPCDQVFVPEWNRNEFVCPEVPGSPPALILPSDCVSNCQECTTSCLGVCCQGADFAAANSNCAACQQNDGVFFAGFDASFINPCNAIAEGALGKCCSGGFCTQTTYANCSGQWFINQDCTTPCPDNFEYFLNVIDNPTDRNILSEGALQKSSTTPFRYESTFYLLLNTNSLASVTVILPDTLSISQLPPGSGTITVERLTGDNTTQYNDQAVIPVTVSYSPWVDPNINGAFKNLGPIYLPLSIKNSSNTTVLSSSFPLYFNGPLETERGCKSCSTNPNSKYKMQIRAKMQRYCTDCQKFNTVSGECEPSVLKEQQVLANVCVAQSPDCGWGITLDSAVYSSINNIWDCTYNTSAGENTCRVNAFFENAAPLPDLQSGIDPSTGQPYSEFNPRPFSFPAHVEHDYSMEFSNYWTGTCITPAVNLSTGTFRSFKGELKLAPNNANCPGGKVFDPYYNTIEFSPETYSKLAKYGISKPLSNTLLDTLGQKLLTLQNNDGAPNPKLAFNPARQNQSVLLNTNVDITPCNGTQTFNNVNGNAIFDYTPAANEIVKYYLLLSKKTSTFRTTLEYLKITSTSPTPPADADVDGCASVYNWGVIRVVVDSSNFVIKTDKVCSTKIFGGDSDFGNTVISISLNTENNANPTLFTRKIKLDEKEILAGIPCVSPSVYLLGEISSANLDFTDTNYPKGKLRFVNNVNYNPNTTNVSLKVTGSFDTTTGFPVYTVQNTYVNNCSEPSKNNTGIIYDPNFIENTLNPVLNKNNSVFPTLPVYTKFTGQQGFVTGESISVAIDKNYLNAVECTPDSIDCVGGQNGCLKSYDQYAYKNCFKCGSNLLGKFNYSNILQEAITNYIGGVGDPVTDIFYKLDVRPINVCTPSVSCVGENRQNLQYNTFLGQKTATTGLDYLGGSFAITPLGVNTQHVDLGLNRLITDPFGNNPTNINELPGSQDGTPTSFSQSILSNIELNTDFNSRDPIVFPGTDVFSGFNQIQFQFEDSSTRTGMNRFDQYFTVESTAYITGYDFQADTMFPDFWNYQDAPLIVANTVHDPNKVHTTYSGGSVSAVTAIPAVISSPNVEATLFTGSATSNIKFYPNVTLNSHTEAGLYTVLDSLRIEGWVFKGLHAGNATSDTVLPSDVLVFKFIDTRNLTSKDPRNFTILGIPPQWAPKINNENIIKMIFKMKVTVKIVDSDGTPIVNHDGTQMKRTTTKIFSLYAKPGVTTAGLAPPNTFPGDAILYKNKNIDGVCVSIDCTNNFLLCDSLEDC